jgi:hypothetical protein
MQKRNLRVVKWLGTVPVVAVCSACNRKFQVSPIDMKGLQARKRSLRVEFAEHECKDEDVHAAVEEPAS